jgi:low temperature requirement protein LtrA
MLKPWFQPPRLWVGATADDRPRRATWLELFYDLVFVVVVSQLGHKLSDDVTLGGFLGFAALFVPVWWAWIGTTFYANRFDSDDVVRRILMGLQMLAIAALAVNVHHGLSSSSIGFAGAYVASRLMLVAEYLWAGWHIPVARGLTHRYALGFSLGAAMWVISLFVPLPWRLVLWAIGLAIDFATPMTVTAMVKQFPPHIEHLPERFGLFTIIVLGEAVIAVVNGVSKVEWNGMSVLTAIGGFVTAFSLWWIYFDNVSGSALETSRSTGRLKVLQLWLYIHLPLVIGLAATGVGVEHLIKLAGQGGVLPTNERWLIGGAVAICYGAMAVLHRTGVIFLCKARTRHRIAAMIGMLVVAIGGGTLSPVVVMTIIAIVGMTQVGLDLYQGKPLSVQATV